MQTGVIELVNAAQAESVKKPKNNRKSDKATNNSPKAIYPSYPIDENGILSIEYGTGEVFRSDSLYDKTSANYALHGQNGHSLDNITGWWRKYEISERYIVDTMLITYNKDNPDLPPSSISKWYVERTVYELDPTWRQNPYNTVSERMIRGGVETYGNFRRTQGIAYQGNEALTSYKPGDSAQDKSYASGQIAKYGTYDTSKSAKQWFDGYGTGTFFGKDWYLEPFGTNLI